MRSVSGCAGKFEGEYDGAERERENDVMDLHDCAAFCFIGGSGGGDRLVWRDNGF